MGYKIIGGVDTLQLHRGLLKPICARPKHLERAISRNGEERIYTLGRDRVSGTASVNE